VSIHTCGHTVLADVTAVVEHLAHCPETDAKVAEWCRAIVEHVAAAVGRDTTETPAVSPKTRHLTPAEMHAMHRDGKGDSLRDIAAIAGVWPETVRRRIAKWKRENGL
jgi:anti-sigma factor RsiW